MNKITKIATKILRLLQNQYIPVSSFWICSILDLNFIIVDYIIKELCKQGFVIVKYFGEIVSYKLIKEPYTFIPIRVESRLALGGIGRPIIHFIEIDSTSLEIRRGADRGLNHGSCIITDFQSIGRGRLNRSWFSPRNSGILFSLLLRPNFNLDKILNFTILSAVALCLALEKECNVFPLIKWPNDIYLDGCKLAGILTEVFYFNKKFRYIIVGVGVNVNLTSSQLNFFSFPVISLSVITGRVWDRAQLLSSILNQFSVLYRELLDVGCNKIIEFYNQRFFLLGKWIKVRDGNLILEGEVQGTASNGALLLVDRIGQIHTIYHGDVSVVSF